MRKLLPYLICFVVFVSLVSCYGPASLTTSGPRTLELDGIQISEEAMGGFVSWACHDDGNPKDILVEVGFFDVSGLEGNGFILFEGGYSGRLAIYERTGIEHRWDWGEDEQHMYAFVIKADGTGLYYDMSGVAAGESTKAKDVFVCKKR